MKIVTIYKHFPSETDYPQDVDLIRIPIQLINLQPVYVRNTLNYLMRDRMPISNYEAQLLCVRAPYRSLPKAWELWQVYYDVKLKVLVYRIPYFISQLKRLTLARNNKFNPLYWSDKPKGFIAGMNYWSDSVAILHESLLDGREDFPRIGVQPDLRLVRSLGADEVEVISFMFLMDHPSFYAPAPVIEVVTNSGSVSFFDSRYVDFLRLRWVFPGVLINRVDGEPYLIAKKRRILYAGNTGHVVLGIQALEITEEREELWRALSGDFWESIFRYRKRGSPSSTSKGDS